MFREEIKVLDCTIRDGGLINNHNFDHRLVKEIYRGISEAGVDYMEVGYKNSKELFPGDEYGCWKFCDDEDIKKVVDGVENGSKISVMADIGRVDLDAIKPANESPVDFIRVASYVKDIDKAIAMADHFHQKGYETAINIMAISRDQGSELDEALHQIEEESTAEVIYLVDSFGSLYQEPMERLVKLCKSIIKSKEIGFHGHNNQQLAFSNTIETIIHGGNYLDGTVFGIGRAAGNCPIELLIGFLKNPKYDIRPILDLISKELVPLREKLEWGYVIPFAIAGMMNEHPKLAMELRQSKKKDNYREFYESFTNTGIE